MSTVSLFKLSNETFDRLPIIPRNVLENIRMFPMSCKLERLVNQHPNVLRDMLVNHLHGQCENVRSRQNLLEHDSHPIKGRKMAELGYQTWRLTLKLKGLCHNPAKTLHACSGENTRHKSTNVLSHARHQAA